MVECAPDAPMNRGVNEREAFHALSDPMRKALFIFAGVLLLAVVGAMFALQTAGAITAPDVNVTFPGLTKVGYFQAEIPRLAFESNLAKVSAAQMDPGSKRDIYLWRSVGGCGIAF